MLPPTLWIYVECLRQWKLLLTYIRPLETIDPQVFIQEGQHVDAHFFRLKIEVGLPEPNGPDFFVKKSVNSRRAVLFCGTDNCLSSRLKISQSLVTRFPFLNNRWTNLVYEYFQRYFRDWRTAIAEISKSRCTLNTGLSTARIRLSRWGVPPCVFAGWF